jgi:hypothetical protein
MNPTESYRGITPLVRLYRPWFGRLIFSEAYYRRALLNALGAPPMPGSCEGCGRPYVNGECLSCDGDGNPWDGAAALGCNYHGGDGLAVVCTCEPRS